MPRGPSNSLVATPHAMSASLMRAASPPYSVSTISAVMTQPMVQNRLMKLPVTSPTRASCSLLAEPPPVTMKCGVSTIPIMFIITIVMIAYNGNSLAALPPTISKVEAGNCSCITRNPSVHVSPVAPNFSTTAFKPKGMSKIESRIMQMPWMRSVQ